MRQTWNTIQIANSIIENLLAIHIQWTTFSFPHLHQFLADPWSVWEFFFSFLIFHPKNRGFSLQETPLFFRFVFVHPSKISRFWQGYSGKRIACFRIDFLKMMEYLCHSLSVGFFFVWAEGFLLLKAKFFCHLTNIIFMNET